LVDVGGDLMAKAIKKFIIAFITGFFTVWLEDFLILAGLTLIIVNTYLFTVIDFNILIGNYLLGIVLLLIGLILVKR